MDSGDLFKAFETFDADNDGKLSVEEFEFFMQSFSKELSNMRDNKIVEQMTALAKDHADNESKFEIRKLVQILNSVY